MIRSLQKLLIYALSMNILFLEKSPSKEDRDLCLKLIDALYKLSDALNGYTEGGDDEKTK